MAIVAVSVAPLGTGSTSVSRFVAAAERVLREDGRVRYRLDPMFTTLEGDLKTIFEIIEKMHEAVAQAGAARISTVIKIDDRRDKQAPMEAKVEVVEAILANEAGDAGKTESSDDGGTA